jgi:methyl-accepting chemotaxis protein
MNLDDAISAHAQWKTKLRVAIARHEVLDAATIGKDNCCELGKWLYGEGRGLYSAKPEFTNLIAKHKGFHAEAGRVAVTINAKKFDDADKMIGSTSSFGAASNEVGVAINALKRAITETRNVAGLQNAQVAAT